MTEADGKVADGKGLDNVVFAVLAAYVLQNGFIAVSYTHLIGIVQAVLFIIGGKEVSLPAPINRAIQKKGEGCAG